MTKECAQALYRQHLEAGRNPDADWLNDPQNWLEANRRLTPAELQYAGRALEGAVR